MNINKLVNFDEYKNLERYKYDDYEVLSSYSDYEEEKRENIKRLEKSLIFDKISNIVEIDCNNWSLEISRLSEKEKQTETKKLNSRKFKNAELGNIKFHCQGCYSKNVIVEKQNNEKSISDNFCHCCKLYKCNNCMYIKFSEIE